MSGPVPSRVQEAAKLTILNVIDHALSEGWTLSRVCGVLEFDRQRAWRWAQRRTDGTLADRPGGGNPVHGLLEWEQTAILELYEEWGPVDMSHRKLAHRGSYVHRVWVSPSTVDRVLARNGLELKGPPRPPASTKKPWPSWCEWRPNQLWCWDGSQFEQCLAAKYAYAIVDIVSRKWIVTILVPEATHVQVKVLFRKALAAEGLLNEEIAWRLDHPEQVDLDDIGDVDNTPMLLAVSDNGTEMKAKQTRRFMALCSIAQHFGRPGTPSDQAWIESLWSHLKRENPHLLDITDPAVLASELNRIRHHYNTVRLHEAIGYVTPDDEHEGRGPAIRKARREGLEAAAETRKTWHRRQGNHRP